MNLGKFRGSRRQNLQKVKAKLFRHLNPKLFEVAEISECKIYI